MGKGRQGKINYISSRLVELIDPERNCPHHKDEVWPFKSGLSSHRQGSHAL
jgi:hypothetical protein